MSLVTKKAPDFTIDAVVGDGEFKTISLSDYKGKYVVLFFYPADFTFICPTEIQEFSRRDAEFAGRLACLTRTGRTGLSPRRPLLPPVLHRLLHGVSWLPACVS